MCLQCGHYSLGRRVLPGKQIYSVWLQTSFSAIKGSETSQAVCQKTLDLCSEWKERMCKMPQHPSTVKWLRDRPFLKGAKE